MANAPHIAKGKCKCGTVFTPQSMTLTINRKEKGMIIRQRVCWRCYNLHYGKGE